MHWSSRPCPTGAQQPPRQQPAPQAGPPPPPSPYAEGGEPPSPPGDLPPPGNPGGGGGMGAGAQRPSSMALQRGSMTCGLRTSQWRPVPSHWGDGRRVRFSPGRGSSRARVARGSYMLSCRVQTPLHGTWHTWRPWVSPQKPCAATYRQFAWPKSSSSCGPPCAPSTRPSRLRLDGHTTPSRAAGLGDPRHAPGDGHGSADRHGSGRARPRCLQCLSRYASRRGCQHPQG